MLGGLIALIFCCFISIGLLSWKINSLIKHETEILTHNAEQEEINKKLENEGIILVNKINSYQDEILRKQQEIKDFSKQIEELYESIPKKRKELLEQLNEEIENFRNDKLTKITASVDIEYSQHKEKLEKEYEEVASDLQSYTAILLKTINEEKQKLKELQDKQDTYLKEQLHKEEMLAQKDFYRLNLSEIEEQDIEMLRNLQAHLNKKEAIDKLVWEIYYKPAYDILMSHLFSSSGKVCGIYKITCLDNDKAYIGQSVDIKERLKTHIKTALSCAPSTNKLYQEMKKFQPSNFLFEILEVVPRAQLNEREIYWINFYKTKDYGLNKTAGGS